MNFSDWSHESSCELGYPMTKEGSRRLLSKLLVVVHNVLFFPSSPPALIPFALKQTKGGGENIARNGEDEDVTTTPFPCIGPNLMSSGHPQGAAL